MNNRIRIAKGSKANIENNQSIIPDGVPIFNTTEKKLYVGNNNKTLAQLYSEGGIVATQADYASYASSDTSKGTIEERLTRLGFRQGTVQLNTGFSASENYLYRQGNYVIGKLALTNTFDETFYSASTPSWLIGEWPSDFSPKATTIQGITFNIKGAIAISTAGVTVQGGLYKNLGQILLQFNFPAPPSTSPSYRVQISDICIYFGYEAEPLS